MSSDVSTSAWTLKSPFPVVASHGKYQQKSKAWRMVPYIRGRSSLSSYSSTGVSLNPKTMTLRYCTVVCIFSLTMPSLALIHAKCRLKGPVLTG